MSIPSACQTVKKPVTRDRRKTKYFMQTLRNLRNSKGNPGTVEKRVSVSESGDLCHVRKKK